MKSFVDILEKSKSFYGFVDNSTIESLFIKTLPKERPKVVSMEIEDLPSYDTSNVLLTIIEMIKIGLQKVYGFHFNGVSGIAILLDRVESLQW